MTRQESITQLLATQLTPLLLQVEDESHRHHVPQGAQTHFKVTVVSDLFNTLSLVKRHQWLNQLLADEFHQGMHALSLHLYTEAEWIKRNQKAPSSPSCKDGYDGSVDSI